MKVLQIRFLLFYELYFLINTFTAFIMNKYEKAGLSMLTPKQEVTLGDYNVESLPDTRVFTAGYCARATFSET